MKLSTRSRYGVRMLYDIAQNYGKKPVILREIAKRQQISEKYLSKLIIPLKQANLVHSERGSQGGYTLARDPSQISVREIVEILESGFSPVDCVRNEFVCPRVQECPTRSIWAELEKSMNDLLGGISLEDLLKRKDQNEYSK